jgi:hypothetical protein
MIAYGMLWILWETQFTGEESVKDRARWKNAMENFPLLHLALWARRSLEVVI